MKFLNKKVWNKLLSEQRMSLVTSFLVVISTEFFLFGTHEIPLSLFSRKMSVIEITSLDSPWNKVATLLEAIRKTLPHDESGTLTQKPGRMELDKDSLQHFAMNTNTLKASSNALKGRRNTCENELTLIQAKPFLEFLWPPVTKSKLL